MRFYAFYACKYTNILELTIINDHCCPIKTF